MSNNTGVNYDVMCYEPQPLDVIFTPKKIALIGATEKPNSVGRTLLWNLISNPFGGTVFPVNNKRESVLGIKSYHNIVDISEEIDLAVIATPSHTIPNILHDCVKVGVKGAIIISAGFKEIGEAGIELEKEILQIAKAGKIRVIGPNCLGVMCPPSGLNATFASTIARPGNVGFISQSGALCTAILDWSFRENLGFSAFVSIGSMLDVDWGDLIYYLGDDPNTQSIVIYMESIGNPASFLSAAREVALIKPIIVLKSGRQEAAAKAAASHTGSLAGNDEVLDIAFRRCGVLRVDNISELFNMAELLSKQPRPKGRRLSIVTNAGGPGVIATDALIKGKGRLANLSPTTVEELNQFLPSHWSHHNPIDILGDATPERYAQTLKTVANDSNSDALLVILTPQEMTNPTETAKQLKLVARDIQNKPILATWMGGSNISMGKDILSRANIYTHPYPDTAARLFNLMWQYSYNLRNLYQTPILTHETNSQDKDLASKIIQNCRKQYRNLLTEFESKQLLSSYGIPTVETRLAKNLEEAVEAASSIGYPVVLKLHSETITHKTDVGGVKLNLGNSDEVREAFLAIRQSVNPDDFLGVTVQPMVKMNDAYELILGGTIDPQFGPVLLFGKGGELVEIERDRALGLVPLNTTLARWIIKRTRIYEALKGVRGRKSIDLNALDRLLVLFSQLIIEQRWIKEIDINPILASSEGLIALDARVVLFDQSFKEETIPPLVIRPYPSEYVVEVLTKDHRHVEIRPIRPEDEPLVVDFFKNLSDETIYYRYFQLLKLKTRLAHQRIARICFIDYAREMALVADYLDKETGKHTILGIGNLTRLHGYPDQAELGLLVNDKYQRIGLGNHLLKQLIEVGSSENFQYIFAEILPENTVMQHLCTKTGFTLHRNQNIIKAIYEFKTS